MDPDKLLEELFDSLRSDDKERALENAQALIQWLSRGGFLPTRLTYAPGIVELLQQLNRLLESQS